MDKCIIDGLSDGINSTRKRKITSFAPTYDDLGQACRDVFGGGYNFGLVKLNFKTKIEDSGEVKAGGTLVSETGDFSGNLASSYKMKDHGITLAERWSTDQILGAEFSIEDKLVEGLKLGLDFSLSSLTGEKACAVKSHYKTENLALTVDSGAIGAEDSAVGGSVAIAYDRWLMGYQAAFNTAKSELTKNNFAFGYSEGDFILHTSVHNLKEFSGSVYRKVNPQLETGVQLAWQTGDENAAQFGIGCKYNVDEKVTVRAKVDEAFGVGLSIQAKIHDGITCTMSALINGKSLNEGGHQVGLALDLEA